MNTTLIRSIVLAPLCAFVVGCALPGSDKPTLGAALASSSSDAGTMDARNLAARNVPIPEPSSELIRAVQQQLDNIGLNPGPADGAMGPNSLTAMRLFKVARRLPVNDDLTPAVLTELGL